MQGRALENKKYTRDRGVEEERARGREGESVRGRKQLCDLENMRVPLQATVNYTGTSSVLCLYGSVHSSLSF